MNRLPVSGGELQERSGANRKQSPARARRVHRRRLSCDAMADAHETTGVQGVHHVSQLPGTFGLEATEGSGQAVT